MVEVVDTTDLKSVSPNGECGFESHSGYIIKPSDVRSVESGMIHVRDKWG